MENHPIPQDVTGFKFKLIGSVTVKQFLYILGGVIVSAILYMLPIGALIKWPLIFLFSGTGAALAFIPIEGRPMDVMMKNFLRALPAENQFIYHKKGAEALIMQFFSPPPVVQAVEAPTSTAEQNTKRNLLYNTLKSSSMYRPDAKEQATLTNINSYFNENETPRPAASPPQQNIDNMATAPHELQASELASQATTAPQPAPTANQVITAAPKETPMAKPYSAPRQVETAPPPAPAPAVEAAPQKPAPPPAPPEINAIAPNSSESVTTVAPKEQLKAGFPQLPDIPNIVLGIIKDPRGKVLPNILVEIMNTQGIPVRAFKTNALGQFTAATPLTNGEYNVILEDPKKTNEFGPIKITLDGTIFEPLEINSVDAREKLRLELFGNQQAVQAT